VSIDLLKVAQKSKDLAIQQQLAADDYLAAQQYLGATLPGSAASSKSTAHISVQKVAAKNAANMVLGRLTCVVDDDRAKVDAVRDQLRTAFGDDVDKDLLAAFKDLELMGAKTQGEFAEAKSRIDAGIAAVDSALDHSALPPLKESVEAARKGFMCGVHKSLVHDYKQLKKAIVDTQRSTAVVPAEAAPLAPAPPLHSIMLSLVEDATLDAAPSNSIYEAKGGVRGALCGPSSAFVGQLSSLAMTKKALKDMTNHLKTNMTGTLYIHSEPPKLRKVVGILKKAFDPMLFQRFPLPSADWSPHVHEPAWFGFKASSVTVSLGHMALTDVRVVVSGVLAVGGLPLDKIPGDSVKDKRKQLTMMTIDVLKELLHKHGFVCRLDSTKALVCPSGFMCIYAPLEECCGLRWTTSGDEADSLRVRTSLYELLVSFPELKNPSQHHQQLLDCLD
jgi:hypothetical protein